MEPRLNLVVDIWDEHKNDDRNQKQANHAPPTTMSPRSASLVNRTSALPAHFSLHAHTLKGARHELTSTPPRGRLLS